MGNPARDGITKKYRTSTTSATQRDLGKALQRRSRRENRGAAERADWSSASPEIVLGAIVAVTNEGAALRFGYTRDGAAYAIGVLDGDNKVTEYVRESEDVNQYLRDLTQDFNEPLGSEDLAAEL